MWAGGKMVWDPEVPLMIGQRATATWGIDSVKKKVDDPQKIPMVFVNQRIDITMSGNTRPLAQSCLFRRKLFCPSEERSSRRCAPDPSRTVCSPVDALIVKDIPTKSDFSFTYKPTLATLFRYSALMFNAHSVHLDLANTQKEGYPGKNTCCTA
ncbi:hypothetical protein J132_07278 [Termitomyces sp. J132]|nr:hypothetical protein J132_07278 [Termitomyces sp. J132]